MYDIEIADQQSSLPLEEVWLRQVATTTLQAEEVQRAEIVIAIVDDEHMHALNRRHLDHDYPTDVLSFLYDEAVDNAAAAEAALAEGAASFPKGRAKSLEGEVILSSDTAIRQAREYGWPAESELLLYLVHGVLHLCGYDDQTETERTIMRNREQAVLKIWGLTPHYRENV